MARQVPNYIPADTLDEYFDKCVNKAGWDIEEFYLAIVDLSYQGTQVTYHLYHEGFLLRARGQYARMLAEKEQEHDTTEPVHS